MARKFPRGMVALRVDSINRKVGMMPVNQRIIKADTQAFGAKRFDKRRQKVAAVR